MRAVRAASLGEQIGCLSAHQVSALIGQADFVFIGEARLNTELVFVQATSYLGEGQFPVVPIGYETAVSDLKSALLQVAGALFVGTYQGVLDPEFCWQTVDSVFDDQAIQAALPDPDTDWHGKLNLTVMSDKIDGRELVFVAQVEYQGTEHEVKFTVLLRS